MVGPETVKIVKALPPIEQGHGKPCPVT